MNGSNREAGAVGVVARARRFARIAHGSQVYSSPEGARPYVEHLDEVVVVLHEAGYSDRAVLAAALLHDVLEDTNVDVSELRLSFPIAVTDIVEAVTDAEGGTRAERKAATYPRIRSNPYAVLVKLADRIANVEAARATGHPLFQTYRNEHEAFTRALHRDGEYDALWTRLNDALTPDASVPETAQP